MISLWLLVGVLSAVGGVLLGMKAVVTPDLGWESLIPAFAAMVLGGIGSPVGAVLGALLLGVVPELAVPLLGEPIRASQLIGGAFILGGIVLVNRK